MKRKQRKFVIGSGLIILVVLYLAYSGYRENRTTAHTVMELYAMKDSAYDVRLQVSGDVVPGSIQRHDKFVDFVIGRDPQMLRIRYIGKEPPPDTLLDGATAIVTGKLGRDGVFIAEAILTISDFPGEHA